MRPLNTYMFLLILCISLSRCFTLSTWPPGVGFGNGVIDLGGLLICQIKNFATIWTVNEGGPDNIGATFYEPSELPDGFFMLGSYSQSNTNSLPGWVVAGKDTTNDPSEVILKSPIDYTLVLNSTSLPINQDGTAYIWRPIAPEGYIAIGNVITRLPEKPSLDKIRCVRSDFVTIEENGDWIWGSGDSSHSNSLNLYSTVRERGSRIEFLVPTGTFLIQGNGSTATSVLYLKNLPGNFSAMPNMAQIQELIKKYSPVLYFHPDEHFFPSSVSWFFENGGLLYARGQESKPVLIDPTGSNLPQGGSNDGLYWLDLPIDDASVKRGDLQSAGSYIHIKPTLGATCTDIAIWIFYPYNGPAKARVNFINIDLGRVGEHVGDWEHVTLRVSNFDGELKSLYFSQHSKGTWLDATKVEYQNGNKPVVYSSLHGHAAFPNAGTNLMGNGKIGVRNDAAKGKMFMDTGINYTIICADYLKPLIGEPSWLNYAREWGPKINYDLKDEINKVTKILPAKLKRKFMGIFNSLPNEVLGEEGPTGPKWKDSWDGNERV
ncbi:hypothetical protein Leryth_027058 [Lithospermum erythrorhizon]|nr:hypothetical protein Leryth_027058 [Lithospermum erythrorhizon]